MVCVAWSRQPFAQIPGRRKAPCSGNAMHWKVNGRIMTGMMIDNVGKALRWQATLMRITHIPPNWSLPPQREVLGHLGREYTVLEFNTALKQSKDRIPIEVVHLAGGPQLLHLIHRLCNGCLNLETCPSLWKDAIITYLYKQKDSQQTEVHEL